MRRVGLRLAGSARIAGARRSRSKLFRLPSRSPDKARDTFARLFDLLEARRVTRAYVTPTPFTERAPRDRDDLLFEKKALRELLVVHSRGRDVREAVERTARLEAVQTEIVEALQHHLPPPVVLADHPANLVLSVLERLERRILTRGRHAHHRVLMNFHHLLDHLCGCARVSDTPAGHGIGLRESSEVDRALPHAGQLDDRAVLYAVDEAVVDLVGVDEEVVLFGELCQTLQVVLGQDRARRVVRETEQDRTRARRYSALDVLGPQTEGVLLLGRHRHRDTAGEHDPRDVGHIRRIGNDHLIAVVERRAQREVDRLRNADGDEDLALGVVSDAPKLLGVIADCLTQRTDAVVGGVFRLPVLYRADRRLAKALRRDEIRLADAERDDAFGAGDEIEEAPDPARGDALDLRVRERTTSGSHAASSFGRSRWCGVARS